MNKNICNLIISPFKGITKLKKKNLYLLGDWCSRYQKLDNCISHSYHWNDQKKLTKDLKKLEILYEEILKDLSKNLNKIHGVKKKNKYWRILIGPWLYFYLTSLYDKWEIVRSFCSKNKNKKINIFIVKKKYSLPVPFDTEDFYKISKYDDYWNYFLFLEAIKKNLGNKNLKINKSLDIKPKILEEKKQAFSICRSLKKKIIEYLSIFSFFFNKTIIDYPYINNKEILTLSLKIKQFPSFSFNFFKVEKVKTTQENNDLRKKLISIQKKDEFFNFFLRNIIFAFPKVFLENYKNTLKSKFFFASLFTKNIFSASNYLMNEGFKIWAANQESLGVNFNIMRHGGFVDQRERGRHTFDHLYKISNHYCDWNNGKDKKTVHIPPLQLHKFINLKKNTNRNKLIILEPSYSPYNNKCSLYPHNELYLKNLKFSNLFLKNLKTKIRNQSLERFLDLKTKKNIKNIVSNKIHVNYCDLKKNIINHFEEAKIIICKYIETPVVEALYSGLPFLILVPKETINIPYYGKVYDLLKSNNLLFHDPILASNFINKNYDNLDKWRNSKKVVKACEDIKKIIANTKDISMSNFVYSINCVTKKNYNEKKRNFNNWCGQLIR